MKLFDADTEQTVLGTLILHNEIIGEAVQTTLPEAFFVEANRLVFDFIKRLFVQNLAVDLVTLTQEATRYNEKLEATGKADGSGYVSVGYIASLTNVATTAANLPFHLDRLNEFLKKRRLEELIEKANKGLENAADIDELLSSTALSASETLSLSKDVDRFSLDDALDYYEEHLQDASEGILTGFGQLDELTQGFQQGEMILVGARPSIGKTAFGIELMLKIAILRGIPTAFLSLEMDRRSLINRMVMRENESGFPISRSLKMHDWKDRDGNYKREFTEAKKSIERLRGLKVFAVDVPNAKLSDVILNVKAFVRENGVKIVFLDYIGLVNSELPSSVPNWEKMTYISKSIKQLARDCQIPIVCLCQLTRESEGAKPNLSQLRDSGSLEQDADVIILLHGPRYVPNEDGQGVKNEVDRVAIVDKSRNGLVGEVKFKFVRDRQMFKEVY